MPEAMKLVVNPLDTDAVPGLISIMVNSGADIVRTALFEVMPFAVAVMVVLPTARDVAMPLVSSVATLVLLDIQVTAPVTLPVLASE